MERAPQCMAMWAGACRAWQKCFDRLSEALWYLMLFCRQ